MIVEIIDLKRSQQTIPRYATEYKELHKEIKKASKRGIEKCA